MFLFSERSGAGSRANFQPSRPRQACKDSASFRIRTPTPPASAQRQRARPHPNARPDKRTNPAHPSSSERARHRQACKDIAPVRIRAHAPTSARIRRALPHLNARMPRQARKSGASFRIQTRVPGKRAKTAHPFHIRTRASPASARIRRAFPHPKARTPCHQSSPGTQTARALSIKSLRGRPQLRRPGSACKTGDGFKSTQFPYRTDRNRELAAWQAPFVSPEARPRIIRRGSERSPDHPCSQRCTTGSRCPHRKPLRRSQPQRTARRPQRPSQREPG